MNTGYSAFIALFTLSSHGVLGLYYPAPTLHVSPKSPNIPVGTEVELTCKLTDLARAVEYIDFLGFTTHYRESSNTLKLTLTDVGKLTIFCMVKYKGDPRWYYSQDKYLQVIDRPELSAIPGGPTIPGDSLLTLTCMLSSVVQNPEYNFYLENDHLINALTTNTMEIGSAKFVDSGNYTCEIICCNGILMKSDLYGIFVQERPTLTTDPAEGAITPGARIAMTCSLTKTKPSVMYSFFRGTALLKYQKSKKYVIKHADFSLSEDLVCTARYNDLRVESEPRTIVSLGCPTDFPNEDYRRRLINSITPKEETRRWGKPEADTQKNGKK